MLIWRPGQPSGLHAPFPASILNPLAFNSGASRIQQEQALNQLETYVHDLFVMRLPVNFFVQMGVAGACITIAVIVGRE